ncbi:MAG: carboxypeptidase-like regulatory domain-containing protein [Muribaculaceae bacterium]|nr:carboxypeptidase-like regulatory domain-containing protein [Muribaculaceae bacterium]
MKRLIFITMLMLGVLAAGAQSTRTVRGAVIDKNGNPLPGAEVFATGGAETTLTNADGTFSFEVPVWLKSVTARYAGMNDRKLKTDFYRDMIFTLSPYNKGAWFINAAGGYSIGDFDSGQIGLMGGYLGKWGGYAKVMVPTAGDDMGYGMIAVLGATKRISSKFYAYLGIGYGGISYEEYSSGSYYDYEYWEAGAAIDGGLLFKFNHFNFSVGYTHTMNFEGRWNCMPNVSVGYAF